MASDDLRDRLITELRLLGETDSTQTAHFQHAAATRNGLGVTDMRALSILLREGPQTAGDLIAHLAITSGAVTGVIDRLEARGVAVRDHDPADRRKVIVRVDLEGLNAQENVYLPIGAAFDELYRGYTTEQLQFLIEHLRASVEITRRETAALRQR